MHASVCHASFCCFLCFSLLLRLSLCLSVRRSVLLSLFVVLANMFNICTSLLLQKLWVEHLSAFLITDTIDYGFSNSPSDTPQSVMKKQRLLNILPNTPVYHWHDGRITTESPMDRNVQCLGDLCVVFSSSSCQTPLSLNSFTIISFYRTILFLSHAFSRMAIFFYKCLIFY